MADGQMDPLNESGVKSSREVQSLQGGFESVLCSETHHLQDPYQPGIGGSIFSPDRR
jgi:hypothetical protein